MDVSIVLLGLTMKFNSRGVSLLLAISIATVTTAFLSLVGVTKTALLVTFILSFSSGYILIKIVLDFLIFNELSKLYGVLNKLKKKDLNIKEPSKRTFLNPLKGLNQEIFTYAVIKQREIDELKKMAAFRREFIADVSHELKTPIFAAQGFVHTLLDGAMEDENVRDKFLKKAAKSLDGLDVLVQDLLTLSQMETGEIKMHRENFNLYETTREIFDQMEDKAEKKEIKLEFAEGTKEKIIIFADQQRIYQVMINLISNAIKYTRDGGVVTIGFETEKNDILIYVKDNGRGIPKEHITRIFERFYRVEKSRSKDKGGTGLGLAIVKHVIEAHHSTMTVTSTVGKGSIFSFKLPKGKIL